MPAALCCARKPAGCSCLPPSNLTGSLPHYMDLPSHPDCDFPCPGCSTEPAARRQAAGAKRPWQCCFPLSSPRFQGDAPTTGCRVANTDLSLQGGSQASTWGW